MTLLLLKITLLLSLGLALPPLLRTASAATRHLVIVTALAASLLLPGLLPVVPAWEALPAAQESAKQRKVPAGGAAIASVADPSSTKPASRSLRAAHSAPMPAQNLFERARAFGRRSGWTTLAAMGWAAGAAAMLLLLAFRLVGTQRRVRRSTLDLDSDRLALLGELARTLGIKRPVELRLRGAGEMPMVWGFRRPVVLLPTDADRWSCERLRAVLAHELAHVTRRDLAAVLVGHVACAAHWFHPWLGS